MFHSPSFFHFRHYHHVYYLHSFRRYFLSAMVLASIFRKFLVFAVTKLFLLSFTSPRQFEYKNSAIRRLGYFARSEISLFVLKRRTNILSQDLLLGCKLLLHPSNQTSLFSPRFLRIILICTAFSIVQLLLVLKTYQLEWTALNCRACMHSIRKHLPEPTERVNLCCSTL